MNAEKESNDICCQLTKIWEQYKGKFNSETETNKIVERGFFYSKSKKSDIVFLGINPYCNEGAECVMDGFRYKDSITNNKKEDRYFTNLNNLIKKHDKIIIDYLDLFYFRGEQKVLNYFRKEPLGITFLVEQLTITQRQLEKIKPKLIIVFNKAAHDYLGRNIKQKTNATSNVWLGYDFDDIQINGFENKEDLKIIKGLVQSDGRIAKDDITKTNLEGTLIYFSKYLGRAKKETKEQISENIRKIIQSEVFGNKQ
jgi:hypothetical protein